MKPVIYSLLALCVIGICACGFCGKTDQDTVSLTSKPKGKVLIVYYSQSKAKNTQTVANWIHAKTGGDIYEIEMETPYPDSYKQTIKESKKHRDEGILPQIKPFPKNIKDYDIIFIGAPIWYGTFPPPVATFLKDKNFAGKKVIPFCTHGGGGAGTYYEDIAEAVKGAKIEKNGLTVKGSNQIERRLSYGTKNKVPQDDVTDWLNDVLK